MDPQEICRLCSFKLHKPRNIFTQPGLLDKISKFTDIKIVQGDGLPCSICDLCDIKLQITDKFRRQIREADKLVRASVLKQAAELNESWRSAFKEAPLPQNSVSKWLENGDRPIPGFRPQPSRRCGISRERMRLTKLSQSSKLGSENFEQSLIYSYATARSLVASYKALINRCWTNGYREKFALPSSFASSDNESDEGKERAAHFSAACRRTQRKRRRKQMCSGGEKLLKNITRAGTNYNVGTADYGVQDVIGPRIPADPLNLLKVKSIQPLDDEDSVSSADSFWPAIAPVGAPGCRVFAEELELYSSSESSSSKTKLSEKFRQFDPSVSSRLIVKNNGQHPRRDPSLFSSISDAAVDVNDGKVLKRNRKLPSAVQCPFCDRICANTHGLKIHFRIHRSAKCQICDAPTVTKEKFRDHMQLHVNSIEPNTSFQCRVCKNIFKTNVGLNTHMRIHSKSVPAVKECPHCMRTFASLRGFKIHLARSHSGFVTE